MTRHAVAALLAAAVLAGCATAGAGMDDAKHIVDRAQPLRCEIAALEARVQLARPGSDEAAALAAGLEKAKGELKLHHRATMFEYIDVMKQLSFEERQAVRRYSDSVGERCSSARRRIEDGTRKNDPP